MPRLPQGRPPLAGRIKRVTICWELIEERMGVEWRVQTNPTLWADSFMNTVVPVLYEGWSESRVLQRGEGIIDHTVTAKTGLPPDAALVFVIQGGIIAPSEWGQRTVDVLFECDDWEWVDPGDAVPTLTTIYEASYVPLEMDLAEQEQKEQAEGAQTNQAEAPAARAPDAIAARDSHHDPEQAVHDL